MAIAHFHLVRKPGEDEQQMACHIPDEQCCLGEGSPEEIGEYVVSDAYHKISFQEYRRRKVMVEQIRKSNNLTEALDESCSYLAAGQDGLHFKQHHTDDLAKTIVDAIQNPKTSNTVDVVRYENGKRIVVGTAEVEIVDGDVRAVFVINSGAVSKRFGAIGPFSIGERSIQADAMDRFRDSYTRKTQEIADKLLGPIEQEVTAKYCFSLDCKHYQPHKHGSACTSACGCNRHGRVD